MSSLIALHHEEANSGGVISVEFSLIGLLDGGWRDVESLSHLLFGFIAGFVGSAFCAAILGSIGIF